MDTKKLEALAAAVQYGSFTRAAEALGYTQSGMTHMMNSLERDIGFPVLLRGRALAEDAAICDAIRAIAALSPFRYMVTRGGFAMSVAMTNCGAAGWSVTAGATAISPQIRRSARPGLPCSHLSHTRPQAKRASTAFPPMSA